MRPDETDTITRRTLHMAFVCQTHTGWHTRTLIQRLRVARRHFFAFVQTRLRLAKYIFHFDSHVSDANSMQCPVQCNRYVRKYLPENLLGLLGRLC